MFFDMLIALLNSKTGFAFLPNQNIINPDNIEFTTYVSSDVTSEYRMRIEGQLYAIVSVNRLLNQPLMVVRGEKITKR